MENKEKDKTAFEIWLDEQQDQGDTPMVSIPICTTCNTLKNGTSKL